MIRHARESDFAGIMALYAELHPEDPALADGSDRQVFDQILAAEGLHLLVLEGEDQRLDASCYLNVIPNITRAAAPYAIIENVITRKARRNTGLGKAMIGHALNVAWSAGCYKVMLQTGSRRESTHRFYRSCGFRDDDKFAFVARPPSGAGRRPGDSPR